MRKTNPLPEVEPGSPEWIKHLRERCAAMTLQQRAELLVRAKILDDTGHYHPDYFSAETVEKDRAKTERKRLKESFATDLQVPEGGTDLNL